MIFNEDQFFILSCDQEFKLIEILKEKNIKINLQAKEHIIKIIAERDYTKFLDFMLAVKTENAVFNHSIELKTQESLSMAMTFGGVFINGQYLVACFSTPVNYQQFMEINNDLINAQREAQKKNATIAGLLHQTNQLNAELQELNATKDRLFSIIGHDLRTPLANIISSLNLIACDRKTYEEFVENGFFENLSESAGLTMQMLENVLEWSRIQLGEQSYNPKKMHLQELTKPIVRLFGKIAKDKDIELIEKEDEPILFYGDPQMIEVIIRNLISNAIKYTQPSGKVVLDAKIENEYVIISIEDNGVGMSPEKIATLLSDSLVTIERGTNGEKGTGFGLLLCNRFIKDHHGKLKIESAEGKGSKFELTLPLNGV